MDLFDSTAPPLPPSHHAPLAERVRPQSLDEFVGQEHLLGAGKPLRTLIESDAVPSMIFWGPPGSGKPHSLGSSLTIHMQHFTNSTLLPPV